MAPRFEVTVWNNTNGDIVKYARDADEGQLQELEDWYGDEPEYQIVIDDEWDEDEDD